MMALALLSAVSIAGAQCLDDARRDRLVTLRSPGGHITAVIDPVHGGNLVGLQLDKRELLYRGMNFCPVSGWDGKAPILWPATGRNYAGDAAAGEASFGWIVGGQRYPMPIHGFARDQSWRVVSRRSDSLTLELTDDARTRSYYPYGFHFRLVYTLKRHGLTLDHRVVAANGQGPMPFSIGNHATFVIHAGAVVSTDPTKRITLDAPGRPTGVVAQQALDRAPVEGFARLVASSMAGYAGVANAALDLGNGVRVSFSQSARGPRPLAEPVRYNLWGDPAAGYFAVEPWYGRQNSLADGSGIVFLPPKGTFEWKVEMRFITHPTRERN